MRGKHRIASALQRQMELMADLRHPRNARDKFLRHNDRLQRTQPHALNALHVMRRANRIQQRRAVLHIAPVAGQVDARQHDLFKARLRKAFSFCPEFRQPVGSESGRAPTE